jgi:putative spermidine/putrescine transport system ATP-binding protein
MSDVALGLELRRLVKHYGSVEAVRGVDLGVREGEFLTVLGPSGSGKTTILRLVSGFTLPTSGQILLRGRDVSRMTPAERGVGMVFQQYALFPHMTVNENIAYGLKMRGWPRERRYRRVEEMAELVGLRGMGRRLPRELSGGQQQRVALARALAFEPALLLMDEPLGALDRELRIRMAAELRRIHRELGTTVVYVTHDREEAMTLSDRVAIMHLGLLEALDTPHRLFSRPATRFVAGFFGGHNLVPATLRSVSNNGHCVVECLGQELDVATGANIRDGSEVWLAIPAPSIRLRETARREFLIDARVRETLYIGDAVQVTCGLKGGGTVNANVPVAEGLGLTVESDVTLRIDLEAAVVVADSQGGKSAAG